MEIFIQIIFLIIGFIFLIKGAELFVSGSSNIGSILKVPTIIIGLTIVALGTSTPEAAVSIAASLKGNNAIALGNVIGSNVFNSLAIIGSCAVISKLGIEKIVLKRDFPLLSFATILLTIVVLIFWQINRFVGLIFLIIIFGYIAYIIIGIKKSKIPQYIEKPKFGLGKSIFFIIIGLVGVIIGGNFVVDSAKYISIFLGMSETLAGLTIVAIGTSLPELVTSLTALKRGENDLVIGNVVGSNIFNILFILGISSLINPIPVASSMLIDLLLLIVITIICYIFAKTGHEYDKKEGILLLLMFILYMAFIIIRN